MKERKLQPKEVNYTHENTGDQWLHTSKIKRREQYNHPPPPPLQTTTNSNHWSLISRKFSSLRSPIERYTNRGDSLLHLRKTPQYEEQIPPQGKGLKMIFQEIEPKKQAGIATLISNKIDLKLKLIKRERRTLNIHQRKIQEDGISIFHIYTPNTRAPKLLKNTTTA